MQIGGNDLLSIARRLRGYADDPGTDQQKRKDLLVAADALCTLNAMLSAEAGETQQRLS
jgi:hypothetical protein